MASLRHTLSVGSDQTIFSNSALYSATPHSSRSQTSDSASSTYIAASSPDTTQAPLAEKSLVRAWFHEARPWHQRRHMRHFFISDRMPRSQSPVQISSCHGGRTERCTYQIDVHITVKGASGFWTNLKLWTTNGIPASFTSPYARLTLAGIRDNGTQVRAEGPTILRNCVGDGRPSTMLYGKVQ
jgi:hypothetical protein